MSETASITENSTAAESEFTSKNEKLLKALIEKKKEKLKKKTLFQNADEKAVDSIVQKTFESVIGTTQYSPLKTSDWMSKMIQKISKALTKGDETRKLLIHCTICSRTDELSICSANMCSWDTSKDVAVYSEWTSKTVFGAVQVFFITHRYSK